MELKKKLKKRVALLIAAVMAVTSAAVPASAVEASAAVGKKISLEFSPEEEGAGLFVTKISNPDRREREVDGLMAGGDRENSYTWRMAQRGDYIYIATTRNIASALVNMYGSAFAAAGISLDTFWGIINVVTNGDIPRNDANEGANIISYNRKTGEFAVVYTAETAVYFRMAVTFGDDVYFGSYSADPTVAQYILKLDTEGNFTKVFETMGSVSLRANCEYEGHLFFAGADDREVVDENADAIPAKMAVLQKSNEDDTVWNRVADYKDFGEIPYDPIMSSWAGAPIWELSSYNGYIYATAPSMNGFVMFKGHPAAEGETANEYGWYWEEVVGLHNGINNPGLSDVVGGEPGTMRSLIGSTYVFNNELYAYNFDHSFGGEAQAFAGFLQQAAGKDVKASEYLFYLYDSLHNPQKLWKLNNETGKFEECENFTKLTENTTNEYVWRAGEYDGQMYLATMDAGIFYNYLTQLTNGSFCEMSVKEIKQEISYITALIKTISSSKVSGNVETGTLKDKLSSAKEMLRSIAKLTISKENVEQFVAKYAGLYAELSAVIETLRQSLAEGTLKASVKEYVSSVLTKAQNKIEETYNKIDWKGFEMYMYISNAVKEDTWGFDLFRTKDGVNFEVITRSGFGDKYNYGCPSFLATEEGLYIGTCNPFYGGQLYLLKTGVEPVTDVEETDPEEKTVLNTSLRLKKGSATVYVGGQVRIKASGKNLVGEIKYKSSNPEIAVVDERGLVVAKAKGTAKITVSNNGKKKVFTVKVKNPVLNLTKKTIKAGKTFVLKVKEGLKDVESFVSDHPEIVTVSKEGVVKALKKGVATITVLVHGVKLVCKVRVK